MFVFYRRNSEMNTNVVISHLASYLPESKVTNAELVQKYPTILSEQEIIDKCGIEERHSARGKENSTDLAVKAIQKLLDSSGVERSEIDLVIIGTITPECFFPSPATLVIDRVGLGNAIGFDLAAACSGFTYGVEDAVVRLNAVGPYTGRWNKAIVCATDVMSRTINAYDYRTGILFGDAASAALIEKESCEAKGFRVLNTYTKVVKDHVGEVYFKTPFGLEEGQKWEAQKFELDGGSVYRNGVALMIEVIQEYKDKFNIDLDTVDYFVPHQANQNMLNDIGSGLGLTDRMLKNIKLVGNTATCSIPLCLSEFQSKGQFKSGERVLLASLGAGYTLGVVDMEVI